MQIVPLKVDNQYICPMCPKAMKSRRDMVTHIRIHTGEKPFSCPNCNTSFNTKSSCVRHMQKKCKEIPQIKFEQIMTEREQGD